MFGSTDNEFDVKYRNALNGEIQQLLNGMQGVQKSNVLVNLPEESVFLSTEDKEQASASIMINFARVTVQPERSRRLLQPCENSCS